MSGQLQAPASGEKASSAHWIRGWMDPRTGLDDLRKRKISPSPGVEPRPSKPSLYRLSYLDSYLYICPRVVVTLDAGLARWVDLLDPHKARTTYNGKTLMVAVTTPHKIETSLLSSSVSDVFCLLLFPISVRVVRVKYFTTGRLPPISSFWRQAPWDPRAEFLFSNWTLAFIVLL
jgi:hypothetical protein